MTPRNALAIAAMGSFLALSGCGRDRADVVQVLPEGDEQVALTAVSLSDHAGFDVLDRFLRSAQDGAHAMQVYEDLSRLAPDNRLVLLRAAHAALVLDAGDGAPRLAAGILERVATLDPSAQDDPDVQFVELVLATRTLAGAGAAEGLVVTAASAPAARQTVARLSVLEEATDWVGPHGANSADARRMLDAIRQALAAFDGPAATDDTPAVPDAP
jgi:hypothetical protein